MSFLSILKTIGTDALKVEHVVVPVAEALYPPAAPWLAKLDNLAQGLQGGIIKAESAGPLLDANGALKATTVTADFEAGLQTTQSVLALEGKTLTWDDAMLQKAIASQVQAFNDFATLKASFKIVTLTASAPPQVA